MTSPRFVPSNLFCQAQSLLAKACSSLWLSVIYTSVCWSLRLCGGYSTDVVPIPKSRAHPSAVPHLFKSMWAFLGTNSSPHHRHKFVFAHAKNCRVNKAAKSSVIVHTFSALCWWYFDTHSSVRHVISSICDNFLGLTLKSSQMKFKNRREKRKLEKNIEKRAKNDVEEEKGKN